MDLPTRAGVARSTLPLAAGVALVSFLLFTPLVGTLLAARRPASPAGWLFLAMAFPLAFSFLTDAVTRVVPPSWPLGLLATIGSAMGGTWVAALVVLVAVFPTGAVPTRRWRFILWLAAAGVALLAFSSLFSPDAGVEPPVAGLPLPLARPDWKPFLDLLSGVGLLLLLAAASSCLPLIVVRFRRSHGVERQQLKWFAWAASIVGSVLVAAVAASSIDQGIANTLWLGVLVTVGLLPIAAAIAILRYGLFDIDLIIRRTVVYAALSAVLLAAYAASVLLLQQCLAPLTPNNSLAVAVSTLLVAALFSPARRRIQGAVDRRFYRQRYSAGREIARFGAGMRDEVDPERLTSLLAATVDRTVQPASTSVWLRGTYG